MDLDLFINFCQAFKFNFYVLPKFYVASFYFSFQIFKASFNILQIQSNGLLKNNWDKNTSIAHLRGKTNFMFGYFFSFSFPSFSLSVMQCVHLFEILGSLVAPNFSKSEQIGVLFFRPGARLTSTPLSGRLVIALLFSENRELNCEVWEDFPGV